MVVLPFHSLSFMLRLHFSCLILGLFVGCGDTNYATVSGTVTLDGQPVPRGMVQFVPVNDMPTATGEIGPNGEYRLMSAEKTGAYVGKHRVRVEARAVPKDERDSFPASLIPERYNSEETSKLEFEVTPGSNNIDIKLTSP